MIDLMLKSNDVEIFRLGFKKLLIDLDSCYYGDYYNNNYQLSLNKAMKLANKKTLVRYIEQNLYDEDCLDSLFYLSNEAIINRDNLNNSLYSIDNNHNYTVINKFQFYQRCYTDDFYKKVLDQDRCLFDCFPVDLVLPLINSNKKINDLIIPLFIPKTKKDIDSLSELVSIVKSNYSYAKIEEELYQYNDKSRHVYYCNVNNSSMFFPIL